MNNKKNNQETTSWFYIFLNRYYKYLIIVLSLIILLLAVFLWLKPKYLEVKDLAAQKLPQREKKLAELTKYYQDLEELSTKLTEFQRNKEIEMQKLEKILPHEADLANLFAQLETLIETNQNNEYNFDFVLNGFTFSEPVLATSEAQTSQITSADTEEEELKKQTGKRVVGESQSTATGSKSQTILEKNNTTNIRTIDIDLDIQGGGYLDFKRLLTNIEKYLRIMDVASVKFGNIYVDFEKGERAAYVLTLKTYYLP